MKHLHADLCGDLSSQLPDYLDGDAREAICRAIEEHLAECQDCRVVIDTMKKTITLYREAPLETVPSDVHRRLVKVLNLEDIVKPPE